MIKILADTRKMPEPEWLGHRRKGIGGSDAAAVIGMSPYKPAVEVYYEKTGKLAAEDLSDNERIYWGNALEDVVRKEFVRRTGMHVVMLPAIVYDSARPHALANVDGLILSKAPIDLGIDGSYLTSGGTGIDWDSVEDHEFEALVMLLVSLSTGIFEAKTADRFMADKFGDEGSDVVPDYYLIQIQHYMKVFGKAEGRLAVLVGGNDFRMYSIPRDENLINHMVVLEDDFWFGLQTGSAPAVDGSPGCGEFLKRLFPEAIKEEVVLDASMQRWVDQWHQAAQDVKWAESREAEAKHNLQMASGGKNTIKIETPNGPVNVATWNKSADSKTFDEKAFKAAQATVYKEFQIPKAGFRTWRKKK